MSISPTIFEKVHLIYHCDESLQFVRCRGSYDFVASISVRFLSHHIILHDAFDLKFIYFFVFGGLSYGFRVDLLTSFHLTMNILI